MFRRRKQRTVLTVDPETPFSSVTALGLIQKVARNSWTAIKIFGFLVFIIFVLTISLQLQIGSRNKTLDQFGTQLDRFERILNEQSTTTQEARAAAIDAKTALEAAITSAQNGNANQAAVIDALKSIARIERFLCGGPCPEG